MYMQGDFVTQGNRLLIFEEFQRYYCGFFLDAPIGNNAFSFLKRCNKSIYVPPLCCGTLEDVRVGDQIVFSEFFEGRERNVHGLQCFVYWRHRDKEIFICDNHNHAFAFWVMGLMTGSWKAQCPVVHVDQHKDMRAPARVLEKNFWQNSTVRDICDYVNHDLNVGNFLNAAVQAEMFTDVRLIDAEDKFERPVDGPYIADIDLDIFSPDMNYIPFDKRLAFIRHVIEQSAFITIATSPYFMDQSRAIAVLKQVFSNF